MRVWPSNFCQEPQATASPVVRGHTPGAGRQFSRLALICLLLPALSNCSGGRGATVTTPTETPVVRIIRSPGGVPHIRAADHFGLGQGYGYVAARDGICRIAEFYVTAAGERSRYFGGEQNFPFPANGFHYNNLNNDFFFTLIRQQGTVEALSSAPPPLGPTAEVHALFRGHAAGYNQYLAEVGVDGITDPACRGAPWVRPIDSADVFRMAYTLALFAGSAAAVDGIGGAAPTAPAPAGARPRLASALRTADWQPGGTLASNALAIGRAASEDGVPLLLGNPHQTYNDSGIFYQAAFEIPGEMQTSGTTFLGLPFVVIGTNGQIAWSHTTSSAFRFTPFELLLAGPTSYVVDGEIRPMQAWPLTVESLQADGSLQRIERTLYTTEFGPMVTNIAGLDAFVWTPAAGFAMGDPNAGNMRYLNHFVQIASVADVLELEALLDGLQGIPWANTIAVDRSGTAFYADSTVVANADDSKARSCSTPAGLAAFEAVGLPVLDGSRSACHWDTDPDAVVPGIFGPARLPRLLRDDYVNNSNDSHWLTHPDAPLTGFARILGEENTERRLRTRLGLTMIRERLAGSDGLPGTLFSHDQLMDMVFNGRNYVGELWRDDLVSYCNALPLALGSNGPVDVSPACPILAGWDLSDNLDSPGALLFRRIAGRLMGQTAPSGTTTQTRVPGTHGFLLPYDPGQPIDTPRGLNQAHPLLEQALADSVAELQAADIPLDAVLRDYQYIERAGLRYPLHGGLDRQGSYSILNIDWDPARGYPNPHHGNTYTQVISLPPGDCPRISTITTYSQSPDPSSPFHADQTAMYGRKEWLEVPFCAADVEAQALETIRLNRLPDAPAPRPGSR